MKMFDHQTFCKRLKKAMRAKGVKNYELAKRACISTVSIAFYRTGQRLPTLDNAFYIADALGVSLDWLCGLDDKEDLW